MSARLRIFLESIRQELDHVNDLAAALQTDVNTPDWISISEDTDHLKIWDSESGAGHQMGFTVVEYG